MSSVFFTEYRRVQCWTRMKFLIDCPSMSLQQRRFLFHHHHYHHHVTPLQLMLYHKRVQAAGLPSPQGASIPALHRQPLTTTTTILPLFLNTPTLFSCAEWRHQHR
jgi:hypothetical protein